MGGISGMKLYSVPSNIFDDLKDKIGKRCTATSGQPSEELHGSESILNDGSKIVLCHAVDKVGNDVIDSTKLSYPKSLDTKADYLYVKDFFDKKYIADFQSLLDNRMKWVNTSKLDNPEKGITDELHKVEITENGTIKEYFQYELQEALDCKMFKLGFTVDEVKKIIAEGSTNG